MVVDEQVLSQNLNQLHGHVSARELVIKLLQQGRASTYLLVGPSGVGKNLLAKLMAASLHNVPFSQKPHVDTMMFDDVLNALSKEGESKWKKSVDSFIRFVNLSPASSSLKVGIVTDIDRLSPSATNAMLKTLEEPPPHTVLILTAEDLSHILPTIISRAQIVRLNNASDQEIEKYLIDQKADNANELMVLADGAIGQARVLTSDTEVREQVLNWSRSFTQVLLGDVSASLKIANVTKDRDEAIEMLLMWLALARRQWLKSAGGTIASLPKDPPTKRTAREWTSQVDRLQEAITSLRGGANVRITLESTVLAFV